MQAHKFMYLLNKMNLLSPKGIGRFVSAIMNDGINIMILVKLSEKIYGDKIALIDDQESISYTELRTQCENLSINLQHKYDFGEHKKVAFLCRNHASLVKAIFSVSRLGADIYLLNTEMSSSQFEELVEQHQFDLIIYDEELTYLLEKSTLGNKKILCFHDEMIAINHLVGNKSCFNHKLKRASASKIVLLTGGTTGKSKKVMHQPSLMNYVNPFLSLLTKLKLVNRENMLIATPIYHGYGIAILLSFIALGKTVVLTKGFAAEKVCELVREHQIEAITVVPLMIDKMLKHNANDLTSLRCIASGGAILNPKLVIEVNDKLGEVLFNLYGTSESGLNCIATPADLKLYNGTIGKAINGGHLKILDTKKKEVEVGKVGQFYIKNSWSMKNPENAWIGTGDLGYKDQRGFYYLRGRTDDMIVSAGENVYPIQLEQILIKHHLIKDVAVVGIEDDRFGQRLCAFVEPINDELTSEAIFDWLHSRTARYHMPKKIIFISKIPYTSVGKQDKKSLKIGVNDYM
ncbi:AMP-binding protein [Sporosarcina beigongshangi]|uniref:AMP-binding protein n=1 Tax=Sporosarcina beigongshangi TaxID=2782538 RepID=UPI001939FE99|nr:AMP-binding protein [Sporosarcina beigongshangi]